MLFNRKSVCVAEFCKEVSPKNWMKQTYKLFRDTQFHEDLQSEVIMNLWKHFKKCGYPDYLGVYILRSAEYASILYERRLQSQPVELDIDQFQVPAQVNDQLDAEEIHHRMNVIINHLQGGTNWIRAERTLCWIFRYIDGIETRPEFDWELDKCELQVDLANYFKVDKSQFNRLFKNLTSRLDLSNLVIPGCYDKPVLKPHHEELDI